MFNKDSAPLGPPGSADLVLTARRSIHDLDAGLPGYAEKRMTDFYAVLEAGRDSGGGGITAPIRGPRSAMPATATSAPANIVAMAKQAGFVLEASSEINANPKDTKDHPLRRLRPCRPPCKAPPTASPPTPLSITARHDAIGESDRMTLRFRKPG